MRGSGKGRAMRLETASFDWRLLDEPSSIDSEVESLTPTGARDRKAGKRPKYPPSLCSH
jgi:hypothetical protein